ncbi:hypothetical protein MAM1_0252c08758 [Mucor ambiguus]|uniref:Uncharacterized protein n=1 Tax=Mucor ambiguus TaxID=91626 RepID=A0A0C9MP42_9FUNG|nr:hypothetical protein MAM1_0252c08758 [Mucor ambiguus]
MMDYDNHMRSGMILAGTILHNISFGYNRPTVMDLVNACAIMDAVSNTDRQHKMLGKLDRSRWFGARPAVRVNITEFSRKQSGFLVWLQSDVDDYSVYVNQLNQGNMKASQEAAISNGVNEEHITSNGSVNQDLEVAAEEHPNYAAYLGETYDENTIFDQMLSELETNIYPGPEFMEEWRRLVEPVDGAVSTDTVLPSNAQQPELSSITNFGIRFSEVAADNKQEVEQTRDEQCPAEKVVVFDEQSHLNNPECIAVDETQRVASSASSSTDGNDETYSDSHDNWTDENVEDSGLYMREYDRNGKSFSSWLFYGSDDDMEVFKSTSQPYTNKRSMAKFTASIKDVSSSK